MGEPELGAALVVHSVSKTFRGRGEVAALNDVSFEVPAGGFLTLLGPSGCGKSTLLSIIAGLEHPDAGQIQIDSTLTREPTDKAGIMFQDPVLLPWRTTIQNVLLPQVVRSGRMRDPSGDIKDRAMAVLDRVGLGDFAESYPWELSGGMQRRASLARILLQDPSLLLMDEPFAGLDEFTRLDLNVLLRRLLKEAEKTVLLVTHSVEEAVLLGDRVGILTPRPGELAEMVEVPLPAKRDEETMASEEFLRIIGRVRRLLASSSVIP